MYCVYGNSGWYIHCGALFGGGPLLGGSVIGGSTVYLLKGLDTLTRIMLLHSFPNTVEPPNKGQVGSYID